MNAEAKVQKTREFLSNPESILNVKFQTLFTLTISDIKRTIEYHNSRYKSNHKLENAIYIYATDHKPDHIVITFRTDAGDSDTTFEIKSDTSQTLNTCDPVLD